MDFTKQYSYKAYQHQRSGPTSQSLPSLEECDAMIQQQKGVLASMERIRDVIVKQRDDLLERNRQEQGTKAAQEYDDEHTFIDKTEGGGGFAGADAKKRRGVCFLYIFSSNMN